MGAFFMGKKIIDYILTEHIFFIFRLGHLNVSKLQALLEKKREKNLGRLSI